MPLQNKYAGRCHSCGVEVEPGAGKVESVWRRGRSRWLVWCLKCFNASDNSGDEDRCCGNRAYEDRCARACGFDV